MRPGDVVADRFVIERRAGSGGMGAVYRALDNHTGEPVALKLLNLEGEEFVERFTREAGVLAELDHPGVVRYVAHGLPPRGEPYLAMEWLEGTTLAEHLTRRRLGIADALTLARRIAEALGVLHRRGLVHRDLKPGNVFLPLDSTADAKLFDFGIARRTDGARELTRTGALIGTPAYMAPEQARGERDIDARVDVFALGCLLFKCLAGRAPFEDEDALTVLLKLVLEDPPELQTLNDEVPDVLAELISRMLAKAPASRPRDGSEVAELLDALGNLTGSSSGPRSTSTPALTSVERRVACLVLLQTRRGELVTRLFGRAGDEPAPDPAASARDLRAVVAPFGAKLDLLADGSIVVAVTGAGAPTDLAARAARCALQMHSLLPEVPIALVTGREVPSAQSPLSEAIERGVQIVRRIQQPAVRLDPITAGLLDVRFEVGGDEQGLTLHGERDAAEATRTLLGRVTPCVGREQELTVLEAMHAACVDEPMSTCVLVTSPAGVGKSRLRYEFGRRLAERGASTQVWLGRADPMSAGSPFGILASALRRAFGLLEGDPLAVRQRKLWARVGRHLDGAAHARVAELIGELIDVPTPHDPSVLLRAARKDPTTMGEQMRIAWEDLLRAECSAVPVLLVLEDLHWGDLPTVHFVDAALQQLREQPLMVLALARPEVHELFPKLWSERDVRTIRLGQLTRKAAQRLVRDVLGPDTPQDTTLRIVERAAGNAFYLEELIRSVSEGKTEELPDTVLAMAEARLERLDAEARRVLRAASVFGQVFWPSGVAALLGRRGGGSTGASASPSDAAAWLETLARQEVVSPRPVGDRGGEPQYTFRHALVREAAYAMLTDDDRRLGHRLAGQWLEQAGLADPMALAEHFERGGEPARALGFYHRAAAHALEGNDFDAALARAQRAIDCGASGEVLGALHLLASEAWRWRGELAKAADAAEAAMASLPRATDPWFAAANELASATATLGRFERLAELGRELEGEAFATGTGASYAIVSANIAVRLFYSNYQDLAEKLFMRLEQAERIAQSDPAAMAAIHQARGYRAHGRGDLGGLMRSADLAHRSFVEAGKLRDGLQQRVNVGYAALELGDYPRAELALRAALADSERLGLSSVVSLAKHNLGLCLARLGAFAEAREVERDAIAAASAQGHARMVCGARLYLALILTDSGALEEAEREARAAIDATVAAPLLRPKALAALAQVELQAGAAERALETARQAHAALEANPNIEEGESLVRLVVAEALAGCGDTIAARAAIGNARERLMARAAKIGDASHRSSFLERVPENARTLLLWRRWTGDP